MSLEWQKLAPHKPIEPCGTGYVASPWSASERIAQWITAGEGPVLLGGPVGIGKSTELAHATTLLKEERFALLVQLGRLANMRTLSSDEASRLIVVAMLQHAHGLGLPISAVLKEIGSTVGRARRRTRAARASRSLPIKDVFLSSIGEIIRLFNRKRICLLIDGTEKIPEPIARGLFEALAAVSSQLDLVVVVPWYAAFGPGANQVIQSGEKFIPIRAVPFDTKADDVGRNFFRELLARRLSMAHEELDVHAKLINEAAAMSGGSPRTFLQLLAAAAVCARFRGRGEWPDETDLTSAFSGQVDTIRRLLLPGDKRVLEEADGTDGTEIEIGTRIRLLSHGLLFERDEGNRALLRMPPLVTAVVKDGERI